MYSFTGTEVVYGVVIWRTRQDTTTVHVSLVESSAVVSSFVPLFMSHLKLTVQSLKVADGKLSKQRFCWLVVVEIDNLHIGLTWLWERYSTELSLTTGD